MVVVITCVEIIIYHAAPIPPPPPPPPPPPLCCRFPSPTRCLAPLPPPPSKTAAQPEASKAGFYSAEQFKRKWLLFPGLVCTSVRGDCSGENGVPGVLVFNIILLKTRTYRRRLVVLFDCSVISAFRCLCSVCFIHIGDGYIRLHEAYF